MRKCMQALEKMALVPFRVSGAAADQTLEHRLFQIGQLTLRIDQDVHKSSSLQSVSIQHTSDASSGKEKCVVGHCDYGNLTRHVLLTCRH